MSAAQGEEARAELRRLGERRQAIEAEAAALTEVLTVGWGCCCSLARSLLWGARARLRAQGPGGPGLKGDLVDSEGFPRADIDVHAVLKQRNRLSCLQTDHKQLMRRVEELMPLAFPKGGGSTAGTRPAAAISGSTQSSGGNASDASSAQLDTSYQPAFAIVDEVSPASPAADAGAMRRGYMGGQSLCNNPLHVHLAL